jgi:hypothetical protein
MRAIYVVRYMLDGEHCFQGFFDREKAIALADALASIGIFAHIEDPA